jgi:hypothetical protein
MLHIHHIYFSSFFLEHNSLILPMTLIWIRTSNTKCANTITSCCSFFSPNFINCYMSLLTQFVQSYTFQIPHHKISYLKFFLINMHYKSSRRNLWRLYLLSLTGFYIRFIYTHLHKYWDVNFQNANLCWQRIKLFSCKSVQPEDGCISLETSRCLMWIHTSLTIIKLHSQWY